VFRRILVATDLGPEAATALRPLGDLRPLGAAEVDLLHVMEGEASVDGEVVKSRLEGLGRFLQGMGFRVRIGLMKGVPWRAVLDAISRSSPDLVALGARPRSKLTTKERLLGSTASRVLDASPRPVLVLKPQSPSAAERGLLSDLLVAVDFSPASARAFRAAMELAGGRRTKRVILFHAIPQAMVAWQLDPARQEAFEKLRPLKGEVEAGGMEGLVDVSYTTPEQGILRLQDTATLVVVGAPSGVSPERTGPRRTLEIIARTSPLPTLVVR
jgi:nucleotide-binding universal stress UspA family protein